MSDATDSLRERLNKLDNGEKVPEQGMVTRRCKMMEVSGAELLAAAKANPKHPVAKAVQDTLSSIRKDLMDTTKVTMDRVDIEALLDNKQVKVEIDSQEVFQGIASPVTTKVLGDTFEAEDRPANSSPVPESLPAAPSDPVTRPSATPENFDKVKDSAAADKK